MSSVAATLAASPSARTAHTRLAEQHAFFTGLLQLPRRAIQHELAQCLRAEVELPPDEHRRAVLERFIVWLAMEPEEAAVLAREWDAATAFLSPSEQRVCAEVERAVVLNALRLEEACRLATFVPWLKAWNLPEPPPATRIMEPLVAGLAMSAA